MPVPSGSSVIDHTSSRKPRDKSLPPATQNLRLSVATYEIKSGEQHRPTRHINMESSRERSWLQSHMLWATLNGYSVEVMNQNDYDRLRMRGEL